MSASLMASAVGKAALTFITTAGKALFESQKADSLVKLTQSTRVEPITMIDNRLKVLPELGDVLHSLVSLFSGYYLQAVALQFNVSSINTIKILDQLNPSRSPDSLMRITGLGLEGEMLEPAFYAYGLPRRNSAFGLEAYGLSELEVRSSLESMGLLPGLEADGGEAGEQNGQGDKSTETKVTFGKDTARDIIQNAPLSVGKMLEVTIRDEGKSATFPVSVRLLSTLVDSSILTHILSDGTKNITWKERWHAWRSGELELWRDLVLATDLVDDHRQALLKDRTGAYAEILARRRGNASKSITTGTPSLATASNLMVISQATAQEVERKLHGKINDPAIREKIFNMSYLMLLVVVDPNNQWATFYHRGIALPTQLSLRELKVSNKGNGSDVGDILMKFLVGKPPML